MLQLGGEGSLRTFLRAAIEDVDEAMAHLHEDLANNNVDAALDRLHALKNVFLSVGDTAAVLASGDLANALRSGRNAPALLARLVDGAATVRTRLVREAASPTT